MDSIEGLKKLAETIKKALADHIETIDHLVKLSSLLEQVASQSPKVFAKDDIKAYFYEDFSNEVITSITSCSKVFTKEVLLAHNRLAKRVTAKNFPPLREDSSYGIAER